MIIRALLLPLLLCLVLQGAAQTGGSRAFSFLSLPTSAHASALGGKTVSAVGDPALVMANPALLDSSMQQVAVLSIQPFYADISHTLLSYSQSVGKSGMWYAGLQSFDYGEFPAYDASGQPTGSRFDAADYSLQIGHSRVQGPFRLGATMRYAASRIDSYAAQALLFDLGGTFRHPGSDLSIGMSFRNMGFLLSDYTEEADSRLPFDVLLGLSFKPTYMPVRFHFTASQLNRDNIAFFDPSAGLDPNAAAPGTIDKAFRRLNMGLELLFSESVHFRVGYNHLIRQELKLPQASGGAGLAFGFMMKVKRFRFEFTRQYYHAAGGRTFLTLQSDLKGAFGKKKF